MIPILLTVIVNLENNNNKKDKDTAVCLLKTLHYKITKF